MKKSWVGAAAMLAATGMLAGCASQSGSGTSGGTGSSGPVTLTFWHGYTEADGDVLQEIIEEFNDSQDEVTIETEVKTWAVIDETLLTSLSAGNGPQIVAMPAERLPVYADKKALTPLDEFYSGDENAASIPDAAAEMEIVDGVHYGVPTGFVPLSVFYNKALFDEAGIEEFPATWDEWVAAAKELTIDEDGDGTPEQYGLALADHATVGNGVWPSLFFGNGGDIVQDGTSVINSPENVETLEYWAQAVREDKISPTGLSGIDTDELYSSGKAAMTIGGPWMSFISADNNIDYGIAGIPAGPAGEASAAIGVSMAVTAQAEENEAAAAQEFFSYFFSPDVAAKWSLGSGWPPLSDEVAAEQVAENPVVASLTEIAPSSRPLLPGVVNSSDVLAAMDEATQKALAGEDPGQLLEQADQAISSALQN
ncbi:ABC transporter substrate-binding protein [Lysobacter korlensis]|uniref:ABC transporter substrate-binding protein n=1 Tax=Lysobacter korlensis TaxID=553636 RepID=A0ABV6RUG1_9GAMM